MSLEIAPLHHPGTSGIAPETSSDPFLSPWFRLALAREFRLQAVDLHLSLAAHTLTIPAFLRGQGHLVIGAGFDRSGHFPLPADLDYAAVIAALSSELGEQGIHSLELRTPHTIPCQPDHADKVELRVRLNQPCSARLMQFSKPTRRNIRLPFKHGFHYVIDRQPEHLQAFYHLYQKNMHSLGSLPWSWSFFQDIWAQGGSELAIFVGYMDGQPVVASLLLLSEDEAYGAWSGTHPDYKQYSVFLAMLWSIMEYCEQTGRSCYNLGRSSR
ncbi:MAG: GNAT family N-acetyltransferase, partial [Thiolinea sp.]